jgi:hypothetical protein
MEMENDYHRMDRRSKHKRYGFPGTYHITIQVNRVYRLPLGRVVGRVSEPDGSPDAPRMELSEAGRMVERELTTSITEHYPMVEVQDHVVMPDHLHCIVVVHRDIISRNGVATHLGQVIAGFKKGCNRRFWEMEDLRGKPADTGGGAGGAELRSKPADTGGEIGGGIGGSTDGETSGQCPAVYPQGYKVPSRGTTGRAPLFEHGYVDVIPLSAEQLETQRRYIHNNPRSRLQRLSNRSWLLSQRMSIDTHLTLNALKGYLQRECRPSQFDEQIWQRIEKLLIVKDGRVFCDSYGNTKLLDGRALPVVCHRKDAHLFDSQQQRCMEAAAAGAILVSARISKREQVIMDGVIEHSHSMVIIVDNGFPQKYHPSELKIGQCSEGRLLLVTPWQYHYRTAEEGITVAECKTMNCVAQAICRMKDSWWKEKGAAW